MPHALVFADFIPSVEAAKRYYREWRNGNEPDRENYQVIAPLFTTTPTDRAAQCNRLRISYHCLRQTSDADAVSHLGTILDLEKRLADGDPAVVNEVAQMNGINEYVFATMFCHHSNPTAYYGYSRPVGKCLMRLNILDGFCNITIDDANLRNYFSFVDIMQSLVAFYHLDGLTKQEIDIMLKKANQLT